MFWRVQLFFSFYVQIFLLSWNHRFFYENFLFFRKNEKCKKSKFSIPYSLISMWAKQRQEQHSTRKWNGSPKKVWNFSVVDCVSRWITSNVAPNYRLYSWIMIWVQRTRVPIHNHTSIIGCGFKKLMTERIPLLSLLPFIFGHLSIQPKCYNSFEMYDKKIHSTEDENCC